MECGRQHTICAPCRHIMQHFLTARKATSMIQVSPIPAHNSSVVHPCALLPAAVWPLIGLTTWILEFLERLMKECVLFGQRPADAEGIRTDGDDDDDDLFGSTPRE